MAAERVGEDVAGPRQPDRRIHVLVIAMILAWGTFAVDYSITKRFEATGVLYQYDVLFDSDTWSYIECSAFQRCDHWFSFPHPTFGLFFSLPVPLVARVLDATGITGLEEREIRVELALLMGPLLSGLKAAAVFVVMLQLGLGLGPAAGIVVLSTASFSQLVFGSVPESFGPSGAAIAAAYVLLLRSGPLRRRDLWAWGTVALVTTGITLSNLVIVGILFAANRFAAGDAVERIARHVAVGVAGTLLVTGALMIQLSGSLPMKGLGPDAARNYIFTWSRLNDIADRAAAFPAALAHSVATGIPPGRQLLAPSLRAKYSWRFTLDAQETLAGRFQWRYPVPIFVLLIAAAGAFSLLRAGRRARCACVASLLIIAFNWGFHAMWGVDMFLYSQHWHLSLLVVIAGVFFFTPPWAVPIRVGMALLVAAVAFSNAFTLREMFETLERREAKLAVVDRSVTSRAH